MNPAELRKKVIEALTSALGPVGMVKFLLQFESGNGDYTKDRHLWLNEEDVDSISHEIEKKHKKV